MPSPEIPSPEERPGGTDPTRSELTAVREKLYSELDVLAQYCMATKYSRAFAVELDGGETAEVLICSRLGVSDQKAQSIGLHLFHKDRPDQMDVYRIWQSHNNPSTFNVHVANSPQSDELVAAFTSTGPGDIPAGLHGLMSLFQNARQAEGRDAGTQAISAETMQKAIAALSGDADTIGSPTQYQFSDQYLTQSGQLVTLDALGNLGGTTGGNQPSEASSVRMISIAVDGDFEYEQQLLDGHFEESFRDDTVQPAYVLTDKDRKNNPFFVVPSAVMADEQALLDEGQQYAVIEQGQPSVPDENENNEGGRLHDIALPESGYYVTQSAVDGPSLITLRLLFSTAQEAQAWADDQYTRILADRQKYKDITPDRLQRVVDALTAAAEGISSP